MKLFLRLFALVLIISTNTYSQVFDWEWQNPKPTGADHNFALILSPSDYMLFGNGGAVSRSSNGGEAWMTLYIDSLSRNINAASFPTASTGYAAGTSGMIMKTTDGGLTWNYQVSNTTQTIWGIFFLNADTGFAATGGGGVLKTYDGGNTWTAGSYGTVTNYCIYFLNSSTGFLGSSSATTGRLVKTTDGGTSWTDISSLLTGNSGTVRSISFVNSSTGFVSTSSGLIYKTTDAGLSWTQVFTIGSTTTIIYNLAFGDPQNGLAATTLGRVVRTTDGGATWSIVQLTTAKGLYSVAALGSGAVMAGDAGTIYTTADFGATFVKRTNAPSQEQLQRASFPSATTGYVVGGSISTGNSFGDVLKTTDGGATWVKTSFTSSTRVYSVCFLTEQLGYVGVEGPTGLHKTTDGGATWAALNTGTGVSTSIIYDIDMTESGVGYAAYASGHIAKTTNGGDTWTALPAGWSGAACYDIFIVNPSVIYALGPGGRISKSVDGGATFGQLPSLGTTTLYSMHFFSPDTGFVVGSSGKILRTTDGGGTFSEITSPVTTTIYVVRFLNRQTGWFGASGGDVYYTLDGGATWTKSRIRIGSSQSTRDIQFKDGILWLVGTDGMIMRGYADPLIPVELTSFTASVNGNDVILKWTTATETNNLRFDVERAEGNGGNWRQIGVVEGRGNTVTPQAYNFVDANIATGSYSYRLKQVDYDGSFTYSKTLNVEAEIPAEFSLGNNYPNPFNPSTVIKYSLPMINDQKSPIKVTLKVFDILGREVASLVNGEQEPGSYQVEFNTSGINTPGYGSGVYYYQLRAEVSSGRSFVATKKMLLVK